MTKPPYAYGQILTHSLLALYWFGMAVTGSAGRRHPIRVRTPDELTDEALATMLRQIHIVRDCWDAVHESDGVAE